MMAHQWGPFDGQPRFHSQPTGEDDDLFNAALLFLDHHEDSHSDNSDTYSVHTAEDPSPYQSVDGHHARPSLHQHQPENLRWDDLQSLDAQLSSNALQVQLKLKQEAGMPTAMVDDSASLTLEAFAAPMWNPAVIAPPAPPRRVNKRRIEIERLRVESQALQNRLASLQDQSNESKTLATTDRVFGEVLGSAWQNIAARQLEQRHRAESENRRLKNLLNEHKRMAKALRRLVARHANAKAWDPFRARGLQHLSRSPTSLKDRELFETLAASLQIMYKQTDSILSEPMITSQETDFRDVKTEVNGDKSMSLQLLAARTLPFQFDITCEAAWECVLRNYGRSEVEWTMAKDGSLRSAFEGYIEVGDIKGPGRGKMVLRRFDEPDRVVILRSAMFLCELNDNPFLKRPVRHCLWQIIRKPSFPGVAMDHDAACQVVSCYVSLPTLDGLDGLDKDERAALTDDVAETFLTITNFQADNTNEVIDNYLLEAAMRGPSKAPHISPQSKARGFSC